jgi:cholesterol transport system auxiliary component
MKQSIVLILIAALAGCGGSSGTDSVVRSYDLGMGAPRTPLPALRAVTVRAAPPFDGIDMFYRLAWRDAAEIASFAQNRWAAPPAELLRRQLLRALPASSAAPCALEIELQDFSQVFSAKDASDARIELRATLAAESGRIAARGVSVSESNAGANAAAGASAFARAADRAVGELALWVAAQPACRP